MPLYEYECPVCPHGEELIHAATSRPPLCKPCLDRGETVTMRKRISTHKSYSIQGDNSASVTPKRFRAKEPE